MKTLAVFIVVLLYSVTLSSQERITLLFVGDLMQHQAQIDAAHVSEGKYDYSSCFSLIKEQISQADLAIGNLEVTLGGRPYRGYPMFSAPDEYLQAIKDAGFDILLTANNHCLDRGKKGMERTILLRYSLRRHLQESVGAQATLSPVHQQKRLSHCPTQLYLRHQWYQGYLSQYRKLY